MAKKFSTSLKRAWNGVVSVWSHEANFRREIYVALVVIAAMIYLRITVKEAAVLLLVIFAVLILEVLNAVVERITDILKPRLHDYALVIKDMMAAAVLLSSLAAVLIGAIIFLPYLF
ncbi:MAG: diacylglycerol kinase family protein [Candidatus Komeilibacteria bacterium]|nr:diacylglycerol kinase family protein [Candidatus Komeilibacteria bacterium]